MSTPDLAGEYAAFVERLFLKSGSHSLDFTHAALGISTEIYELRNATDDTNVKEELGDLGFYLNSLGLVTGRAFGNYNYTTREIVDSQLSMELDVDELGLDVVVDATVNDLLDHAKRWIAYGKEPPEAHAISMRVATMFTFLAHVYSKGEFGPDEIMQANMRKLLKRYPGGEFDRFRALARDLEAEREALETVGAPA